MTLPGRLESALRSPWLPLALLLLALSTVFVFAGDRVYFYRPPGYHNLMSAEHLTIAVNLSPEHGFQRFHRRFIDEDGAVRYAPYNRFPPGGYLLMKLATLPVSGNPSVQITTARILMLLFFTAIAVLAYLSLGRLTHNRWIALTATLLAFSSYSLLYFNDMTANEGMPDLFGVMLVFHGMVIFVQEGRFRQLVFKTCIALLLGWHVLALLVPFVIIGLASEILRARSAAATSTPPPPPPPSLCQVKTRSVRTVSQPLPAAWRSCARVRPVRPHLQLHHGIRRTRRRDAADGAAVLPIHGKAYRRRLRIQRLCSRQSIVAPFPRRTVSQRPPNVHPLLLAWSDRS